jgi:uncharacterized cupin superfamily protein
MAMSESERWYVTPYGDRMRWIAGADDTGGAYTLLERVAPAGSRSTSHAHSKLIESFVVLAGEFTFEIGGERVAATPGTYVAAQRGVSHAWQVAGAGEARALVLFAPAVKRAYFEELDGIVRAARGGPPDAETLLDLARRYDWL